MNLLSVVGKSRVVLGCALALTITLAAAADTGLVEAAGHYEEDR